MSSSCDSDFRFLLGHKRSYDSDYDSVASENQPLWFNRSVLVDLQYVRVTSLVLIDTDLDLYNWEVDRGSVKFNLWPQKSVNSLNSPDQENNPLFE